MFTSPATGQVQMNFPKEEDEEEEEEEERGKEGVRRLRKPKGEKEKELKPPLCRVVRATKPHTTTNTRPQC